MLKVTNTANLMGITIHGDYEDLQSLREALERCCRLLYDNRQAIVEKLFSDAEDETKRSHRIAELEEGYEFFLSLNYDIRHAYMGTRNFELVSNSADIMEDHKTWFQEGSEVYKNYEKLYKMTKHGNLQYSVEILYPMAIYYYYVIQDMLQEFLGDYTITEINERFQESFRSYELSRTEFMYDVGILLQFSSLLEQVFSEALGEERARHLREYMNNDAHLNESTYYPEALCQYYVVTGKNQPDDIKKAIICLMVYELYNEGFTLKASDNPGSRKDCKDAKRLIKDITPYPFPTSQGFHKALGRCVSKAKGYFYQDDFDTFLEKEYGTVTDEEWDNVFETSPWPEGF